MRISHHPSDDILLAHANGSLAQALSLVVATHLDICALCRETLALGEAMGGALLDSVVPVEMSAGALERVMARLDAPAVRATALHPGDMALPPVLRHRAIGKRRTLAPGIWVRSILNDRASDTRTYLLGAAAGKAIPKHSHDGIEVTQVLKGEFFDSGVRYGPGDFVAVEGAHSHRPLVGASEDCVCVIGSIGAPSGLVGMVVRAFT